MKMQQYTVQYTPHFKRAWKCHDNHNRKRVRTVILTQKIGGECEIRTHAPLPANGFQEVYQRIPFQLSSVQFVLKQFLKSLILQGYSELFGTDMN